MSQRCSACRAALDRIGEGQASGRHEEKEKEGAEITRFHFSLLNREISHGAGYADGHDWGTCRDVGKGTIGSAPSLIVLLSLQNKK